VSTRATRSEETTSSALGQATRFHLCGAHAVTGHSGETESERVAEKKRVAEDGLTVISSGPTSRNVALGGLVSRYSF